MSRKPHFSILATSFAGGPRPRHAALLVFGLWFFIFFCALFAPPLLDDADATHAQAARAMATTGDLVTLRVDGIRYLEKAPLPYWLVAASFRLFGFNTFAAHLPQALAVLLLTVLGHRWANQAFGARTAFYTAMALLTAFGVFLFTRVLIPEVLLSLLLATALFCLLKSLGPVSSPPSLHLGHASERPAEIWNAGPFFYPYAMWTALALAVLTKGLVALVFFFATAGLYLLLIGEWQKVRLLRPFSGLLVLLTIAAPWHVLAGVRNTGGHDGHGFFWFYFWNEHVLRFLGTRVPHDYNRMPGWLFCSAHLVWLFPWTLFLPLGIAAIWRRLRHQLYTLTRNSNLLPPLPILFALMLVAVAMGLGRVGISSIIAVLLLLYAVALIASHRLRAGFNVSPFHRIDPQQKSILLLSLFAGVVLLFFSLSTNQEYYTFPAYLPILLPIAATITRAEQTFATDPFARRWVTVGHAALTCVGAVGAIALAYGLFASRSLPFVPDVGHLLAHRGVGSYTLSTSHLFDLTTDSFAALRVPAVIAALALATGPLLAWALRAQRRHMAATTAIAVTAGLFLVAAQLAFARFGPMLSSQSSAARIQWLIANGQIAPDSDILLYGDQALGSSIPFYLGRTVSLVDGRSTSLWFGSTFADAPDIFLSGSRLLEEWGAGPRKVIFVPLEHQRDAAALLVGRPQVLLGESSGNTLITDRPLAEANAR